MTYALPRLVSAARAAQRELVCPAAAGLAWFLAALRFTCVPAYRAGRRQRAGANASSVRSRIW